MPDKSFNISRLIAGLKRNWKASIFFGAIILLTLAQLVLQRINAQNRLHPKLAYSIQSSTENLKINQNYSGILEDAWVVTANKQGGFYTAGNDYITSFDFSSGEYLWKVKPPGFYFPDRLILDGENIFGTTPLGIEAYDAITGRWKWSIEMGSGHVNVTPQLDGSILRVYYGDLIFEIEPDSGEILHKEPRGNVEWIQGDVELFRISADRIGLRSRETGNELGQISGDTFSIIEFSPIKYANKDFLLMDYLKETCLLDIKSGQYLWCRPDNFVSNVGLMEEGKFGYILRRDFVLEKFDVKSGKVLAETQFSTNPSLKSNLQQPVGFNFVTCIGKGTVIVLFQDNKQLIICSTDR